jgi:hypothetical protein
MKGTGVASIEAMRPHLGMVSQRHRVKRVVLVLLITGIAGVIAAGDPAGGGSEVTVTGQVHYVGELPTTEQIPVYRDRAYCGDTMPNEALKVGQESRGVAEVVISLEGVPKAWPSTEEEPLLIENRTCRFLPRVNAMHSGRVLIISNADPVMHNTHIRKKSRFGENLMNVVQPPQGKVEKPVKEPGFLDVRCDAHPFMRAAIHVFDHPYFAVTDGMGRFQLHHVPPGRYRLKVWHETLRSLERIITVSSETPESIMIEVGPEV